MDLMKEAFKRKMLKMKEKTHDLHDGDAMHEGDSNMEHKDGMMGEHHSDMHEHLRSGSDIAPPIVHGKEHLAENEDENMTNEDVKKFGHPNHLGKNLDKHMQKEADLMGNRAEEHDESDFEYDRENKLLRALGSHNVHSPGASSLSGRVADKAKERFASIEKEKKFGAKKFGHKY
jgi:hypothetical protein